MAVTLEATISFETIVAVRNAGDIHEAVDALSKGTGANPVVAECARAIVKVLNELAFDITPKKKTVGGSSVQGSGTKYTPSESGLWYHGSNPNAANVFINPSATSNYGDDSQHDGSVFGTGDKRISQKDELHIAANKCNYWDARVRDAVSSNESECQGWDDDDGGWASGNWSSGSPCRYLWTRSSSLKATDDKIFQKTGDGDSPTSKSIKITVRDLMLKSDLIILTEKDSCKTLLKCYSALKGTSISRYTLELPDGESFSANSEHTHKGLLEAGVVAGSVVTARPNSKYGLDDYYITVTVRDLMHNEEEITITRRSLGATILEKYAELRNTDVYEYILKLPSGRVVADGDWATNTMMAFGIDDGDVIIAFPRPRDEGW